MGKETEVTTVVFLELALFINFWQKVQHLAPPLTKLLDLKRKRGSIINFLNHFQIKCLKLRNMIE